MNLQKLIGWLLVSVVPAMVWSAYVYISRMTRVFSTATDYLALAVAIAVGIVGVLMLFRSPRSRAGAAVLYIVFAGTVMYLGMVTSLCWVGDCP